jgi:outer membrane receptor protein involved in Fe transport
MSLKQALAAGGSGFVMAAAMLSTSVASAQTVPSNATQNESAPATIAAPSNPDASTTGAAQQADVIVTGSRISRLGFDAPTPTTVVGDVELRQGARPNIGQVLDDLPQFRGTTTPQTTNANSGTAGTSTADLRGLGAVRTLTLLDGHRFLGSNDLNSVPQSLVKRVDVVTGGASAAWGSGAVAGVVNIVLDDQLHGFSAGGGTGISSRGDDPRYSANMSWGGTALEGRLHLMIAGEYVKDEGILDRASDDRPNLQGALFQQANGQLLLTRNVNSTVVNVNGIIDGGKGNGLVFNPDGSLSPLVLGSQTFGSSTIGGNGQAPINYISVSTPYQRGVAFGRASFDISSNARIWVNGNYSRVNADYPFYPETTVVSISADNPFLTPTAKAQLAAVGATYPLSVGLILGDVGPNQEQRYQYVRQNIEESAGIDGSFGTWHYSAYFDHGRQIFTQGQYNQRITANFNKAVDAVTGPNGTPVCRVNADASTANDDPACVPINLLGAGNISSAAIAYAFGGGGSRQVFELDTGGANISGQPFSTWAGPVDLAVGGEARREASITTYVDPLSQAQAFATYNYSALNGSFSVEEGYGELNVPILDLPDKLHVELNGAARYSHYSTSGGIWSWKYGGTAKLFQQLLLRGTYSRDIRSPEVDELYSPRSQLIGTASDPFIKTNGLPTTNPSVINYVGGNPNLLPETAKTLTVGGSYSPAFAKRFSLSVDYYHIDIANVIATLTANDNLARCYAVNPNDPTCGGVITRNAPAPGETIGTISSVQGTFLNLADYETNGLDIDASYVILASDLFRKVDGAIRFRILANHVFHMYIDNGKTTIDRAGDVGDSATFTTPKWRGTASIAYEGEKLGLDARLRYVGGGNYDSQQAIVNNHVDSRTYLDLGLRYKIGAYSLGLDVDNVFDRQPPPTSYFGSAFYDNIGRYLSMNVGLKF